MDCIETINRRRSIRKFKNTDIGKENMDILMNAAQAAPSAGNMQGRDFIIVSDRTIKRELVIAAHDQHFIASAPVIIVAIANILWWRKNMIQFLFASLSPIYSIAISKTAKSNTPNDCKIWTISVNNIKYSMANHSTAFFGLDKIKANKSRFMVWAENDLKLSRILINWKLRPIARLPKIIR